MDSQQERLTKLIADTIVMLCKNGVRYEQRLVIQGLIGITSDDGSIMLVPVNETLGCQATAGNEACTSSRMATHGDPQPQRTIRGAPSGRRRPRGGRYNNVSNRSVSEQMYDAQPGYVGNSSNQNQYDIVKTEDDVKQEGYDGVYADGDNYFNGQNDYGSVPAADQSWTIQNSGTIDVPFAAGFGDIGAGGTSVQVHRTIQYTSTSMPAADDYGAEFSSNPNDYGMPPPAKRGHPSQSGTPRRGGGRGRPPKAASEMPQQGASREELGAITDDKSKWETVKVYRFACKLCSRIFNHQPNLFQHQITAHGRPKKERGAGRGAAAVPDGHDPSMWETVKVARFACKLCGALFNHQPNLFQHQITNHGRPKKVRGGGGHVGSQDFQDADY